MSLFDCDYETDEEEYETIRKTSGKATQSSTDEAFKDAMNSLEVSLYQMIKNSKDQVFKCHCLARLNTDEAGLEDKLHGLIAALTLESASNVRDGAGDDFDSIALSLKDEESALESDLDQLDNFLDSCQADEAKMKVKDEFDELEEIPVSCLKDDDDDCDNFDNFKVDHFNATNDDFDALL